jgi:capsular polysaccharide biosynthesis protein
LEENYKSISLQNLLQILWNNLLLIFACSFLCGLFTFFGTYFIITPQYESKATMIVNARSDPNITITYDQINSAKNLIDTYTVILKSETVINQVIHNLQNKGYTTIQNVPVDEMTKRISIDQVESTQVMSITAKDPDPKLALDIVKEILNIAPDFLISTVKAGSVEIVSPPTAPIKPVSPNLMMNAVIGFILGCISAMSFILMREMFDTTLKSDEEIRNLIGLQVLGKIPSVQNTPEN